MNAYRLITSTGQAVKHKFWRTLGLAKAGVKGLWYRVNEQEDNFLVEYELVEKRRWKVENKGPGYYDKKIEFEEIGALLPEIPKQEIERIEFK